MFDGNHNPILHYYIFVWSQVVLLYTRHIHQRAPSWFEAWFLKNGNYCFCVPDNYSKVYQWIISKWICWSETCLDIFIKNYFPFFMQPILSWIDWSLNGIIPFIWNVLIPGKLLLLIGLLSNNSIKPWLH